MKNIGEKIRIHRVTRNLTQEYMAFALEISQAAYSKLERGETEITLRRIYEIAEIFEISAFEIIPKSKYGSGFNQAFVYKTLNKLKNFWGDRVKKRIAKVAQKS